MSPGSLPPSQRMYSFQDSTIETGELRGAVGERGIRPRRLDANPLSGHFRPKKPQTELKTRYYRLLCCNPEIGEQIVVRESFARALRGLTCLSSTAPPAVVPNREAELKEEMIEFFLVVSGPVAASETGSYGSIRLCSNLCVRRPPLLPPFILLHILLLPLPPVACGRLGLESECPHDSV